MEKIIPNKLNLVRFRFLYGAKNMNWVLEPDNLGQKLILFYLKNLTSLLGRNWAISFILKSSMFFSQFAKVLMIPDTRWSEELTWTF